MEDFDFDMPLTPLVNRRVPRQTIEEQLIPPMKLESIESTDFTETFDIRDNRTASPNRVRSKSPTQINLPRPSQNKLNEERLRARSPSPK